MNQKILNLLKCLLIVFLVLGLVLFSIVSLDVHHMDVCCEEDCFLCSEIIFSQRIAMIIIVAIVFAIFAIILVAVYLACIHIKSFDYIFNPNTLVFQKVQLNE